MINMNSAHEGKPELTASPPWKGQYSEPEHYVSKYMTLLDVTNASGKELIDACMWCTKEDLTKKKHEKLKNIVHH